MDRAARAKLIVAHADWGTSPAKRWMAWAEGVPGKGWRAHPPLPVGEPGSLLKRLVAIAGTEGMVLVGFDFPIGLPYAYAQANHITNFIDLLPKLGSGAWQDFYRVAESPEEISLRRPFYPMRPGGARQAHLLEALEISSMDDLRRVCERRTSSRRAASPLFWTLGGQQVGKAAIHGWQTVLAPALKGEGGLERYRVKLWPFCGRLPALLQPGLVVIAETYPAEYYQRLGVRFQRTRQGDGESPGSGKRSHPARLKAGKALLEWAMQAGVTLDAPLQEQIETGFGATASGEDAFDSVVGLFGMTGVLAGLSEPGEPEAEPLRWIEGWILGQAHL